MGEDISTCANTVDLNADINNTLATYDWYLDDTLISGVDTPQYTALTSGNYKVEITIGLNNSTCVIDDEITITLNGEQISGDITDFVLCDDNSNDGIENFDLNLSYPLCRLASLCLLGVAVILTRKMKVKRVNKTSHDTYLICKLPERGQQTS